MTRFVCEESKFDRKQQRKNCFALIPSSWGEKIREKSLFQ